jgi:hypothetical protein
MRPRYVFRIDPSRRRRLQITAAVLAQLLVIVGLIYALTDKDDDVTADASHLAPTTTSVAANGGPTPTGGQPGATDGQPGATGATTAGNNGTATSVAGRQRKCGTNPPDSPQPPPSDWANYWQTMPDTNQPMTVTVCVDDATPAVGQLVTLTVVADDPDAHIGTAECDIDVSWDGEAGNLCHDVFVPNTAPEPTPAKEHGHVEKTYTHTYEKAGDKVIDVEVWSGPSDGKRHPYHNTADARLAVTVKG